MGSHLPELPRLSPEKHRWERSKTNPRVMQRRGLGAEAIVGMKRSNLNGQYDLYILATLCAVDIPTATALSLSYLKEKLEIALLAIRFEYPDSACTATWDDQVPPIIQYESPENDEDALAWAKDAVHVRTTSQTGFDVRTEIEERRQVVGSDVNPAKAVSIYLVADVMTEDTQLSPETTVDMLLHMNHVFWDGISARMFTGDLLRQLSQRIGATEQKQSKYPWGEEIANLSVPLLDALRIDINSLGDQFNITSDQYVKALYDNYGGRGLVFKPGLGLPRTDVLTFTVAESEAIIHAVKSRLGPKYTISHLAQAAIVIAMLEVNWPSDLSDTDVFVTPMPVNGRRWLRDDLAGNYYSMCETGAVIRFENIKSLLVNSNDDKHVIVEALKKACVDAKNSFDRWLSNPYQLPLGIAVHTFEASFLTSNPMPFDKVASPFFISDGKNERFIPRDIVSAATGETVMTVDKFVFFLNQCLPYLAIRLESWKDASTLSVCYNDGNYNVEEATTFLKSVANYMLAFVR